MNKAELIAAIAEKSGMKKSETDRFLSALTEVVTDAMQKDEKIQIAGFGNFEVKERAAKEGINPKTKEKIQIAACKIPTFKFSKTVKEMIK